jgi:uncharacterized protein
MQVRNYRWDFSDVSKNYRASSFDKYLFNGLSLIFPEGERFFVRSVKKFADRAVTETEQQEIKAFIGQEIQHGKAHEHFNTSVMAQHLDIEPFLKIYRYLAYEIIEPVIEKTLGAEFNLAATAASEHYTATWAEAMLGSDRIEKLTSESLRRLSVWHSLEELEHKHVAFDLLKKVNPSYALRIAGLLLSTAQFIGFTTLGVALLMRQDKGIDWREFLDGARADANDPHGMTYLFAKAFLDYLKPGFHPNDRDDSLLRQKAQQYLEATQGAA